MGEQLTLLILVLYNFTLPFKSCHLVSICKKLGSTVPFSIKVYRMQVPVTEFYGIDGIIALIIFLQFKQTL